jgi:hypothetical protein
MVREAANGQRIKGGNLVDKFSRGRPHNAGGSQVNMLLIYGGYGTMISMEAGVSTFCNPHTKGDWLKNKPA